MEKSIKIPEELHTKIKTYCAKNKLKINEWVDKELTEVIIKYSFDFDTPETWKKINDDIETKIK